MSHRKPDWDNMPPETAEMVRWEIELYEAMAHLSDCPFRKMKAAGQLYALTGEEHYLLAQERHKKDLDACLQKHRDVHCLLESEILGINAAGHQKLKEIYQRKPGVRKNHARRRSDTGARHRS